MSQSVDEYMNTLEEKKQLKLIELRQLIKETVEEVEEKIAWGVPTYYVHSKYFMQIAANKANIGFYTSPATLSHFQEELKDMDINQKNTLRLPYDNPLPKELLKAMIIFRLQEVEKEYKKK